MQFFSFRQLMTALLCLLFSWAPLSYADEAPIKTVATFSILGDMVQTIGGERVEVITLVGPNSDAHVYSPSPADAKNILEADILFVNGFEFEGWLDRLIAASGYKGKIITATTGIKGLKIDDEGQHEDEHHNKHAKHEDDKHAADKHDKHEEHAKHEGEHKDEHEGEHKGEHGHHHHGDIDPHAWHSLKHAKTYINNITRALQAADPKSSDVYAANRDAYLKEIAALEQLAAETLDTLAADSRTVVTSHDAFGYFADNHKIRFLAPQGMSTESEASAKDVAALIEQIRKENIKALFLENMISSRLLEQIAAEANVTIGGKLYSDALSRPDQEAGTYLKMMKHNIQTVYDTLKTK